MRRWLGWIAIGWMVLLCAVALAAYGAPTHAATLDEREQNIASQLRCPVCQGESVADSPADIARGIRNTIRRDLQRGESASQIEASILAVYPNISLAPSTSGIGALAWLAPPLLLLAGFGLLVTLTLDWRTRGRRPSDAPDGRYLERVRAELAATGSVDE